MSRDRLYMQKFFCNVCNTAVEKNVWESKLYETPCDCGDGVLEPIFDESEDVGFMIMSKMSKGEIRKERKQRSLDHFKKEIYPTLSKKDKKHFKKKHNIKD